MSDSPSPRTTGSLSPTFSSEHRRTEILQEALHILFELGSHGLTMRNLAEQVGLSEAALYRHFRGKEDIVQNLTDLACDFVPAQGLGTAGPLDSLEELMYRQLRKLSTTPHLTAIVFEEELFREYPAVRAKLQQLPLWSRKAKPWGSLILE